MKKGYIATVTVLLVMAVVMSIILTVVMLSIGSLQGAWAQESGEEALTFTESCMEDALWNAKRNIYYSGGTISYPKGDCTVTVAKNGNVWTVTTSSPSAAKYKKTIRTVFTRTGRGITMTSWEEI